MREAGRDVNLLEVVGGQRRAHPLPERRRAAADVNRDIENRPLDNPNQLPLHVSQLEVQTADRAADRFRVIVLNEGRRQSVLFEFLGVIGFEKKPAHILKDVRFNDDDTR